MSQDALLTRSQSFRHETHRLPVTALAFCGDDLLLSGEGTYLCLWDVHSQHHWATHRIFTDQVIHGIHVIDAREKHVLAYGGRFARLLTLREIGAAYDVVLGQLFELQDWVLTAAVRSPESSETTEIALVTAHDALLMMSLGVYHDDDRPLQATVDRKVVGNNTILYSAHATWLAKDHILIASGTAFGDVNVWSSQEQDNGIAKKIIHYSFSAHEGSVFDVRISPPILNHLTLDSSLFLLTCSDDRTIRLWNVSNLPQLDDLDIEIRSDTGFSAEERVVVEHRPELLAKVMGHQSRIWHVRFHGLGTDELGVRSFGEDATCITWRLQAAQASTQTAYTLDLQHVTHAHPGKHIWSVAQGEHGRTASGGSDGSIAIMAPPRPGGSLNAPPAMFEPSAAEGLIRTYAFMSSNWLLSSTQKGYIMPLYIDPSEQMLSGRTTQVTDLQGHSIIAGTEDAAFVGGDSNKIYVWICSTRTLVELEIGSGKTAGLLAMKYSTTPRGSEVALLVNKAKSAHASLYLLSLTPRDAVIKANYRLDMPSGTIVTSFRYIRRVAAAAIVLLGCRNGNLLVFYLEETDSVDNTGRLQLNQAVHREAITQLEWSSSRPKQSYQLNDTFKSTLPGQLYSTSRDGTFAVHTVSQSDDGKISISRIHQLELPFGSNIEGLSIDGLGVLVWGFSSKYFVVYSVSLQREVMKVDCGGAHRNWAFQPNQAHSGGTFVWTKASKTHHSNQGLAPYETCNSGGHGREIKAMAVYQVEAGSDQPWFAMLATAAEDTDIKLYSLYSGTRDDHPPAAKQSTAIDLKCVQTLRKHNTGPQHLAFSRNGELLFSSGGFEEFFIWRITRDCPRIEIGVYLESAHPNSGSSDLRITSFEVIEVANEPLRFVFAYSDSSLSFWTYTPGAVDGEAHWENILRAEYLTSCLTSVFRLPARASTLYYTTATDGHIASWLSKSGIPAQTSVELSTRTSVHQSSILTCIALRLNVGTNLLITGGDDNAVGITVITHERHEQLPLITTKLERQAHAAAVTGLTCISTEGEHDLNQKILFLSAGLDQRLILWQLDIRRNDDECASPEISIQKLASTHTCVADVSGIDTVRRYDKRGSSLFVIITGIGIEVLKIPHIQPLS